MNLLEVDLKKEEILSDLDPFETLYMSPCHIEPRLNAIEEAKQSLYADLIRKDLYDRLFHVLLYM